MPTGSRIRANNVFGVTTDNPLTVGSATFNSAGLANLPVVSGNHAVVTLDPLRQYGEPEIVIITTHTAVATVATITRGAYGTTARAHPVNTVWVHAPITEDVISIVTSGTRPSNPYEGQFIFETDTNKLVGYGGVDWAPRDAGGQLGYAEKIVDQGSITVETDIVGLSVAVTVSTNRRIKITGHTNIVRTVADGICRFRLHEDGVSVQITDGFVRAASDGFIGMDLCIVRTPSVGIHTYKLRMAQQSGTGTTTVSSGATFPSFILVEDIGAA